jgi:hypothetical protein
VEASALMVAYSFKRRFVDPIRVGLSSVSLSFNAKPKRQTIRAERNGKHRHARPGDEVQLYCGLRTKGCFLIGRARCLDVQPVRMSFGERRAGGLAWSFVDEIAVGGKKLHALEQFARDDGFLNLEEMTAFWKAEHDPLPPIWSGVIIYWEPLS